MTLRVAIVPVILTLSGVLFPGWSARSFAAETLAEGPAESAEPPAVEPPPPEEEDSTPVTVTVSERVNVVASRESIDEIAGSAYLLDLEELEEARNTDIHRILQEVPGVNFQEEDGLGLRPNIGMRGSGVERSSKITLLEDGVLIAPAPYAAPAAYYFPTAIRMEAVEVRKGSASIKQGPYTNGGALNLVSAAIPGSWSVNLDAAAGQHGTQRLQALVGDSRERFGWMLQGLRLDTDGFKSLDDGGDTGTTLDDWVGKLRFNGSFSSSLQQSVELKLGKTRQDGNETYLGLTDEDFRSAPYRRYVGSTLDNIQTDHEQFQVRHFAKPSAAFDATTTVYRNDFYRNWFKNESVDGVSNASILARPQLFPSRLGILRGEIDSDPAALHLRNNQREYYSRGVESIVGWSARGAGEHQLEAGIRYHEDEEDRFQHADLYQMLGGELLLSESGAPGSNSNRVGDARATALFVQDHIRVGRFSLTPGVRWESIRHRRFDYSRSDPARELGPTRVRENHLSVLIPGIGVSYELSQTHRLFAGLHKGFAPPGTGSTEAVDPEESLNYEIGYRFRSGPLSADVTGFYSDYDNLLGVETVGGGGSSVGDLFNGGAVEVRGLEASLRHRWQVGDRSYLPLRVSYTYTSGEFLSSFLTGFADWSPMVVAGDRLPYLPEHQGHVSLGYERGDWSSHVKLSYAAAMRTKSGSGPIAEVESTDSRNLVDVGVQWSGLRQMSVYAQLRNLLDEAYLASRRPYGSRPGLPQTFTAGVALRF